MNKMPRHLDRSPLQRRTQHFIRRQRERRISCQEVLMALAYGHRHEHGDFTYFYSRGLFLVVNLDGYLVTAYWL